MLILSAKQIREWDNWTIRHKPILSIDLMETAANRCVQWLQQHEFTFQPFVVFCGKGNNGGDGLAIARLLAARGLKVAVYILEGGQPGTADFQTNLERLRQTDASIQYIQTDTDISFIPPTHTVIDAMFGTGLNRRLQGMAASVIEHINRAGATVIAIDMPSGLLADDSSKGFNIVQAAYTLSFQCLKMAFMMAENESFAGRVHVLDIGLLDNYPSTITYEAVLMEEEIVKAMYIPRKRFSHKGNFGHAGIIAGSYGFMGAAVLCAHACVRAGVGKLSCHIPRCGYQIMQTTVPEAMAKTGADENYIDAIGDIDHYDAIGIGPGIGVVEGNKQLMQTVIELFKKPMVIDADALNILAKWPALLTGLCPFSILTPHPTEFDRLFGRSANDFARMRLAQQKARELQVIIILKGHRTFIAMPGGNGFFNNTGNPGMATGGSGDVLTGILTALLAQKYPPERAALMGVYIHGLAGDYAAGALTEEAMIATDIIGNIAHAFRQIKA